MGRRRLEVTGADQAGDGVKAVDLVSAFETGLKVDPELLGLALAAGVENEGAQQLVGVVVVHD